MMEIMEIGGTPYIKRSQYRTIKMLQELLKKKKTCQTKLSLMV